MRHRAGGHDGAGSVQQIVGGHPQSTDLPSLLQAQPVPLPLRSRGPAQIHHHSCASPLSFACQLDRMADFALHLGRHAEAERLAHRAAEMRQAVAP